MSFLALLKKKITFTQNNCWYLNLVILNNNKNNNIKKIKTLKNLFLLFIRPETLFRVSYICPDMYA